MDRYDFLIIGCGPAGLNAAVQAALLGRSVMVVDRNDTPGGVTVHTGTLPSKTLREAILYLTGWRQRGFYGRGYRLKETITAADLKQRLDITIDHEIALLQEQLHRHNIHTITGNARFINPHRMAVEQPDGEVVELEAEKILLATGTRPRRPDNVPFDDNTIIDSDGILRMQKIPKSLIVFGGGVIGTEYSTMFNALDVEVTLVDEHETILSFIDHEIREELIHHLRDSGMALRLGEKVRSVSKTAEGNARLVFENGRKLEAEALLYAAGRIGCTSRLDVGKAGLVANERHQIQVNQNFQTSVEHIYAAGDLIGFPGLASTSMEQGRNAACHAFGGICTQTDAHFPFGIYSVPEISMIGQTENELRKEGIAYEVGVARIRETARGQILGLREGLLKILFSIENRRILGIHIVGEGATELIHVGQAVMLLDGTIEYFVNNAFNYPTLAEAYKVAALDAWNRLNG
ncbi:MAG: Si-specific NAD(P)(+) transhydrogenase [Acidiferrobacterales bacterium]